MTSTVDYSFDFAQLFAGRRDVYGLGVGKVVKRPLRISDYEDHLRGQGSGIGVFPLLDDGTVNFAAVDLDRPDFETAYVVAGLLPGTSWIERSRSGNAHVWAFFAGPLEAWVPRGVMKAALESIGEPGVEVFPKQDRLLEGMVGNYINLPYHGNDRPILGPVADRSWAREDATAPWGLSEFVLAAKRQRNLPDTWRQRARALGLTEPAQRNQAAFGERATLHECAAHAIQVILDGSQPLAEGNRSVVMFNLAKMLLNYEQMTPAEARQVLDKVNAATIPPLSSFEVNRLFRNALQKRYTSTGCDDPLFLPYASPTCKIAHPNA